MRLDQTLVYTDIVPIYTTDGIKLDEIKLPEKIMPTPRRRCGCSKNHIFFKGAGIIYRGNFTNKPTDKMIIVSQNGNEYQKYYVVHPKVFHKFGIFMFPHQPIFSDFEGGCGKKEKNLLAMQKKFELSAIEEITNVIEIPVSEHSIYSYRLKDIQGSYKNTIQLIEYILAENFNSAWDKNLWDDIMGYGYLRDLEDWFESKELKHKLGTIYALLKTLLRADKYTYEAIVKETTGLEQLSEVYLPYIAARIVEKYCPKCTAHLDLNDFTLDLYGELWETIYNGKSCCHLENETEWAYIRSSYISSIPNHLKILKQELKSHSISLYL